MKPELGRFRQIQKYSFSNQNSKNELEKRLVRSQKLLKTVSIVAGKIQKARI
jgi:hypothetical protein